MFKGRNVLKINQSTMRVIVEEWFNRQLALNYRVKVADVVQKDGEFSIAIDGQELTREPKK